MICQTDLNSSHNGGSMLVALWVCHDVMARHHRCVDIAASHGGVAVQGAADVLLGHIATVKWRSV